jgi:hypothetical protein
MKTILSPHPGAHVAPLPERHAASRRALRRTFRLRARSAADDARPDGLSPEPAPGAARYPRHGPLLAPGRHRPGSAGLPDLAVLPYLHARIAAAPRGEHPYPETREAAS